MKSLAPLLLLSAVPAFAVDYLLVSQPATTNILRFNAQTGAAMGAFVASGSGGLVAPKGMTLGPDGNLYVADASSNRVKRFNSPSGSPVGDGNFTPAETNVYPVALKFGVDGDLYVLASYVLVAVRRYNGLSGAYISRPAVATSSQAQVATDFERSPGGDILIVSGFSRASRFSSSTTAFVNFFINQPGDLNVMNQPRVILLGPDGNYWITNRGSNRLTRYDSTTGAKLNDVVDGAPLNGPAGLIISGNQLFVSNQTGNNLLRYTITNAATGTVSAATELIPASAGLSAPEHILKVFIEDPPLAVATNDYSVPGGESFVLDGASSSDPEGQPLTFAWTQLSGLPAPGLPASTFAVNSTAPFTPGSATFRLTVTDAAGRTATDNVTITITAPLDTDNNGLPDRWEATQPTLTGGANDDDDGDGTTNHFEFLAGTSPTDPASFFKLISYDLTPTAASLHFRSGSRNYQFQQSPDLQFWSPVPGHETLPGTGGIIEVTTVAPTGFYRIAAKQDF